jgi:putative nucleotidyltransferase with HDIG domain
VELINEDSEPTQCEMSITEADWEDKPARIVTMHDISERMRLAFEREENAKRQQFILVETINAMSNAMASRDPYTAAHMKRVSELSMAIARELGLEAERIEGIRLGGIIHDIGKLYVPAEILNRPGRLSPAEFDIIKSHAQVGYDIIKGVPFTWPVAEMVYQHHERIDGSGYPNSLKGNEIVLEARILAVADVVEAMTSHRPYRPSLGMQPALDEIRNNSGKLYDPEIVSACTKVINTEGFQL